MIFLRTTPWALSSDPHLMTRHTPANSVRVSHLRVVLVHLWHIVRSAGHALLLSDGTVLVRKQQSLQIDHLLPESRDSLLQGVVLLLVDIDLALQVGQPLLLPLATLERSNTVVTSVFLSAITIERILTNRLRSKKFFRFSSSVILCLGFPSPLSSCPSSSSKCSSDAIDEGAPLVFAFLLAGALAGISSAFRLPLGAGAAPLAARFLPRVFGRDCSLSSELSLWATLLPRTLTLPKVALPLT